MSQSQILHDKIECVECGDVVESTFRHDYQQCGNVASIQSWLDKRIKAVGE